MTRQIEKAKGPKAGSFERNMLETAKGGGFLAAGQIFAYGSRFIIAFFLARLLGAEHYGIYNLAISTALVIASISTFGLDTAMVRYVAMQRGQDNEEGVWGTLQIGAGFSVLMSLLMSLGLYLLSGVIATELYNEPQLERYLKLFCIFIPFSTLSSVLIDAARGFKRMDYSALADNVVLFVARIVLVGLLAIVGLDAFTAIIAFGLSDVAVALSLVYLLNKEFSFRRPLRKAQRNYREIFEFSFPFWLSGLLTKFRKNIQTLLLGTLNTVTSVGIFAIVSRLNLVGHVVYSSVIASVKPHLAELYDKENRVQIGRLYQTTTRWTYLANLPLFLMMVLYPASILSIFGKSFVGGATALAILAVGELVNAGTGICGSIIDMTGYTKLKLANSVVWAVLISGGNILLIPEWGVVGAAVAATVSISTVNFLRVLQVWILFRLQPYNRTFLKPTVAGLAASASALLMGQWLPADGNIFFASLHISVLFAVYAGVVLLLGLESEERVVFTRILKRMNATRTRFKITVSEYLTTRSGAR